MRQISLYIHVPFCTRRCSYCSFYHVPAGRTREDSFVEALTGEIGAAFRAIAEPVALRTVFVGGGTPTVLADDAWLRIIAAIEPWFPAGGPLEFTVEMNPEDVDPARVRFFRALGVNRASLGIQSMHAVGQKVLKRCDPDVNARAIECVRGEFDNVSFDVLLGVPKTTLADLTTTLGRLLEYEPRHLSVYGLEPGGDMSHEVERFFRAVDPDRVADEYLEVCGVLAARGYRHYEVSNFAVPGFESAHNRVYWEGGDYLGVGPAAHSSVAGRRFWNEPSLEAYLRRRGEEHIGARVADESGDDVIERVMLALRTDRGAPAAWFERGRIEAFAAEGLVRVDGERVRLTGRGFLSLNDIVLRLTRPAARNGSIC